MALGPRGTTQTAHEVNGYRPESSPRRDAGGAWSAAARLRVLPIGLACLMVLTASCSCGGENAEADLRPLPTKREMIAFNRHLFVADSQRIVAYCDSVGLDPKPTPNLLWLTVSEHGDGDSVRVGQKVTYNYNVCNLRGKTFYSSLHEGPRTITVGNAEVNTGFDEALTLLRRGDKATIILIPEKAFGYRGDEGAIRGRMTLRYDIELFE